MLLLSQPPKWGRHGSCECGGHSQDRARPVSHPKSQTSDTCQQFVPNRSTRGNLALRGLVIGQGSRGEQPGTPYAGGKRRRGSKRRRHPSRSVRRSLGRCRRTQAGTRHRGWLFKKLPNCLSKWLHHFLFPPARCEGSNSSTPLPTLVNVCLFYCNHPCGREVVSPCGYDLHFPLANGVEDLFMCLWAIHLSSLQIQIPCPFFKKNCIAISVLSCKEFFIDSEF